jgi:hypothetical protein
MNKMTGIKDDDRSGSDVTRRFEEESHRRPETHDPLGTNVPGGSDVTSGSRLTTGTRPERPSTGALGSGSALGSTGPSSYASGSRQTGSESGEGMDLDESNGGAMGAVRQMVERYPWQMFGGSFGIGAALGILTSGIGSSGRSRGSFLGSVSRVIIGRFAYKFIDDLLTAGRESTTGSDRYQY